MVMVVILNMKVSNIEVLNVRYQRKVIVLSIVLIS